MCVLCTFLREFHRRCSLVSQIVRYLHTLYYVYRPLWLRDQFLDDVGRLLEAALRRSSESEFQQCSAIVRRSACPASQRKTATWTFWGFLWLRSTTAFNSGLLPLLSSWEASPVYANSGAGFWTSVLAASLVHEWWKKFWRLLKIVLTLLLNFEIIKCFVILIHLQGLQSFNQQILLTKVVPMYIHLLMKMKSLLLEVLAGFYQCRTTSRDLYVL